MRRAVAWVVLLGLLFAVGALGFWAGRVTLEPPVDPLEGSSEPVTFEVVEQTLGRSLQFAAVAEWSRLPLARAGRPGVVTSIEFDPGARVDVGSPLYTVDLGPVVVAEGGVPAFREMARGVEGTDVAQLQAMLVELGFFDEEPDGAFGVGTEAAVGEWQESLGMDDDGVVGLGDVVFVPELPARVVATDVLTVGAPLAGGEVVVDVLGPAPKMAVPLSVEQRNLVPLSGDVRVSYPEGVWEARIVEVVESEGQEGDSLDLVLSAPEGGAVCGDECAEWVTFEGRTAFEAEIVVVPETTGPVVPTAAIMTDPAGGQSVELASGEMVPVEVVESTDALAIVEGLAPGDVVVLPFSDPNETGEG